jgi:nitrate/nitrite-specific signal transduction histidine kinase
MLRPMPPRLPASNHGRLRWLVVLVPTLIIAALEQLSDNLHDQSLPFPLDNLLISTAVLVIASLFAWYAFRRIDALTGALRARNEELEAREAAARALNRVSQAIAAISSVDDVLRAVVANARQLLAADVAVLLLEGPGGRLVLREASGMAAGGSTDAETIISGTDAMLAFVDPALAVARLSAPLQRGGTTIGLLAVGTSMHRGFDVDEVETLASLASQATISLEHARLEARLRELAVVDERERIARELHDGIAQVLAYVNTKSQAVDVFIEAGRIDEARVQLAELGLAARAVYVDVRETILGLRGPIEPGQGLGAALGAHARRVADASGFALELEIDPAAESLRLDSDAEAHLYRIVQEALTNVRKHAAARRVRLSVRVRGQELQVSVADDGRGLPAAGTVAEMPGYGLRAMRERAGRIGATLQVMNQVGGGALVRVTLALEGHVRETAETGSSEPAGGVVPDPAATAAASVAVGGQGR